MTHEPGLATNRPVGGIEPREMPFLQRLGNVLRTAAVATAGTTVAVTYMGRVELGRGAAPLNATSHILWGDAAATRDAFDVRHTVVGAVLNAGAMLGWAGVQEALLGRWARRGGVGRALGSGALVAALAYVTDYHVVPPRLTPGFEKRLSRAALAGVYGVLALSLAAGLAASARRTS